MTINKAFETSVKGLKNDSQAYERTITSRPAPGEYIVPFEQAPGDRVYENGDNYIVLTKDRPAGIPSGHFAETNSYAIDMVVGRLGSLGIDTKKETSERVDPNFKLDAARIYISQRTDIDKNFDIVEFLERKGSIDGEAKNKSAIGMKADNIRVISREAIKLITMTDRYNSANVRQSAEYGIELIAAANSTKPNTDLQPLVKGKNLEQALGDLLDHVAQIDTQISMIDKMIGQITLALVSHVHTLALPTPITSPPIDPISITNNVLTTIDNVMQIVEVNLRQFNHEAFRTNYLTPGSATYICSPHNKTT